MIFLKYQNKRGGRVILTDIKKPTKNEWGTAQEAMTAALDLEKEVNDVSTKFLKLHLKKNSIKSNDF